MTAIKVTRFSAQSKLLLLSRVILAISLASSLIFILLQSSLFHVNSSSPVSPSSSSSRSSASQLTSSFSSSSPSSSPSSGQFSTLHLFNRRNTLNSKSNSNVNSHFNNEKTLSSTRNNEKANNLHSNFTSTTSTSKSSNINDNNNNRHQGTPRRHSCKWPSLAGCFDADTLSCVCVSSLLSSFSFYFSLSLFHPLLIWTFALVHSCVF